MSEDERLDVIRISADDHRVEFARDVREGVLAVSKRLPCCYFCDREGARIFETICALPEYYLTRTERAILQAHAVRSESCWSERTMTRRA